MLRLDRLHPQWGGNKLFKLYFNLQHARAGGYTQVLSFGGAWSNHLHALAAAAKASGLRSIGVVRGDEVRALTPTLQDAVANGMELLPVSRADYKLIRDPVWLAALAERYPDAFLIPEGGDNALGLDGCELLGQWLYRHPEQFDLLVTGVGTGTTLAGLARGMNTSRTELRGILAARDLDEVQRRVDALCSDLKIRVSLTDEYARPGFGRLNSPLKAFWSEFEAHADIQLDPVYTLKALYAISAWSLRGELAKNTRILMVHTGGLQGRRGFCSTPCGYNDGTDNNSRSI